MAVSPRQWLRTAWVALGGLALVAAQTTTPSNTSSPVDANAPGQLILTVSRPGMTSLYTIDPLTMPAGANQGIPYLEQLNINGNLQRAAPSLNLTTLQAGQMAYINCEPDAYTGNLSAAQTIRLAASKIAPPPYSQGGAIILYSTQSNWCSYTTSDGFQYMTVYTTTNATASKDLENWLRNAASTPVQASITIDNSTVQNGTNDALGPSPTTAVAMIILYSITGIITALFLIIIITGAIRAHRHPERYGPRIIAGRPRQSRAKGIARAMLETLPIVKFGERADEPDKPTNDVELAESSARNSPSAEQMRPESAADGSVREAQAAGGAENVETVKAASVGGAHEQPTEAGGHHAEMGLACSVCTDDFIKGQDIRVLPCDHKFHPECIDPWLLNVSGTCPLCRVDLRPTTSISDDHDPTDAPDASSNTNNILDEPRFPGPALRPAHIPTESNSHRRRPTLGLLNIRRMRDATPEERVAALRGLRNANRADGSRNHASADGGDGTAAVASSSSAAAVGGRARTGLHGRLTRFFGGGSGSSREEAAVEGREEMAGAGGGEEGEEGESHVSESHVGGSHVGAGPEVGGG